MAAAAKKTATAAVATTTETTPDDAELLAIEAAGADQDNSMITPDGDRFFPDSAEDAAVFRDEHDAVPEHPDRWPWPDDEPPAEAEPFDPAHCPTPGMCFPYGLAPDTSHAACIHGETHASGPAAQ